MEDNALNDLDELELSDICNLIKSVNMEDIPTFYRQLNPSHHTVEGDNISCVLDKCEKNTIVDDQSSSLSFETFEEREVLLNSVREKALTQGYSTKIKWSKKNKYVIIGCDRGGTYRPYHVPADQRKRTSSSRLIECPFEIWGKRKSDGSWKVEIKNLSHNHELSNDMSGHPYCRRLSEEDFLSIKEMTMAGIPPRQILTSLRQKNPKFQAIARTVYNSRAKINKDSLAGRTPIQAL